MQMVIDQFYRLGKMIPVRYYQFRVVLLNSNCNRPAIRQRVYLFTIYHYFYPQETEQYLVFPGNDYMIGW